MPRSLIVGEGTLDIECERDGPVCTRAVAEPETLADLLLSPPVVPGSDADATADAIT